MIPDEGDVVPLQSGDRDPLYSNYVSAGHVEGKAALWMRDDGSRRSSRCYALLYAPNQESSDQDPWLTAAEAIYEALVCLDDDPKGDELTRIINEMIS